jgi:small subunit ribosomal protein S21
MLIVKVNNPKQLDKALKILKIKVSRTKIISELKDRMEYKKPSVRKREEKLRAIYIQKKKNEEE